MRELRVGLSYQIERSYPEELGAAHQAGAGADRASTFRNVTTSSTRSAAAC
jgi:hypothetical protein